MRPKIFSLKLFLASFVFFLSLFSFLSNVSAETCAPGVTPVVCPSDAFCRPCDPPTLQGLEVLGVQVLGVVWVLTGLIFFGLFIYNAYLYMFNKLEVAKKRMSQWVIGLLMILLAQPIVATVMQFIISDSSVCYEALQKPQLTFFFPQVCTDSNATVTPTATPAPYGPQACHMTAGNYIPCSVVDIPTGHFRDGTNQICCLVPLVPTADQCSIYNTTPFVCL